MPVKIQNFLDSKMENMVKIKAGMLHVAMIVHTFSKKLIEESFNDIQEILM